MTLYKFQQLENWLDDRDYPKVEEGVFRIIKGVDFKKVYEADKISFEDDGIYLNDKGKKYRGYMFIKEPYIVEYGNKPKFHLTRCHTIDDFILRGQFKIRYDWSNSNVNDLIDKTTRQVFKDEVLDYCSNCKRQLFDGIENTEDFFDQLDKGNLEHAVINVDIFGYDRQWQSMSRAYRKEKEFTCESCGIQPKSTLDRRFWDTHHKDGDKTNNLRSNLECLCKLCHAFSNPHHLQNFSKNRMKVTLDSFYSKYSNELRAVNNPYLEKYLRWSRNN